MESLIVVNNPKKWHLAIDGVQVVSAKSYLTGAQFSEMRKVKVFNLCRSYRYQSIGYYVSLLASARGHKPLPSIETIQDMKSFAILRLISDELEDQINRSLKPIQSDRFILSVYLGKNFAKRYDRLSFSLFKYFQIPFMRAEFRHSEDQWLLHRITPLSSKEIPVEHREFVNEVAGEFFSAANIPSRRRQIPRYDLAILHNPDEEEPPSNGKALDKFVRAAKRLGLGAEMIQKDDYGLIPQFDALFIRETTNVNHHTYRFSRRAAAEGLVVIDDPLSIEQCTNKVFLAELLNRHKIPAPKTLIVHQDNKDEIESAVGLPCIVKKPDSAFSQGVYKAEDEASLTEFVNRLLGESELIVAQEFLPTEFDWRIGIIDRQPLYACRYHMAKRHWQIMKALDGGDTDYGKVDTLFVEDAPREVTRTALRAANLIGDGFYGVDLKQIGKQVYVIEINDNPSIESGFEDAVLKDVLYDRIMSVFLKRIEKRKEKKS